MLTVLKLYAFPSCLPFPNFGVHSTGKRQVLIGKQQVRTIQPIFLCMLFPGYARSSRGVCSLFLSILGFPATYLGRLWLECRGWAIVPKLISASSPPQLSSWLWAGFPYALQDIKIHLQQEHPSKRREPLSALLDVLQT